VVGEHTHRHRAHVPARCGEPAQHRMLCCLFVDVMRLRIELAGKFDDLLPGDVIRPAIEAASDGKVFKIKEVGHERTIPVAKEITWLEWRNTINGVCESG